MPAPQRSRFGFVRQLPSGRWQARYRVKGSDRVPYPGVTYDTEVLAWHALEEFAVDQRRGLHRTRKADIGLAEFAERWLTVRAGRLAPATAASYASMVHTHIARPGTPLSGVMVTEPTPLVIEEWLASLSRPWVDSRPGARKRQHKGVGADTRRRAFVVLNMIMDAAVGERYRTDNPCSGIRPVNAGQVAAERRSHYFLYLAEVRAVLDAMAHEHEDGQGWQEFFTALFWSGARPGEMRALWVEQLYPDRPILNISAAISLRTRKPYPKNTKARTVYIPEPVMTMLRGRIERLGLGRHDYLWTDSKGGPMWDSTMESVWVRACKRAGVVGDPTDTLPGRQHMPIAYDLRASYISHMLGSRVLDSELRSQVGHQKSETTDLYTVVQMAGREDPITVRARTEVPSTRGDVAAFLYHETMR